MTGLSSLARRSVRARTTSFTACFVTVFLGTALVGSFATLVQTATQPMTDNDRSTCASSARWSAAGVRSSSCSR